MCDAFAAFPIVREPMQDVPPEEVRGFRECIVEGASPARTAGTGSRTSLQGIA
jgi:hypothetical protein